MAYLVEIFRIWSFSGPYFPAFGLNTEIYGVNLRIHSECGKIQTRKTPNTDTFYAVTFLGQESELYLRPCQISMMKMFVKIVNG